MSEQTTHRCNRCGRILKTPEAIALGFGPVCYQKFLQKPKLKPLFTVGRKSEVNKTSQTTDWETKLAELLSTDNDFDRLSGQRQQRIIAKVVEFIKTDVIGGK